MERGAGEYGWGKENGGPFGGGGGGREMGPGAMARLICVKRFRVGGRSQREGGWERGKGRGFCF